MRIGKRQFKVMLWIAGGALFFLGGVANAAFVSPVGTWDLTVSGAKLGSAYLTFNDDGTITGYILVIPAHGNTGGATHTASFGFATLSGEWEPNQYGQIAGFLNNPPSDTVRLDITSFLGRVSKNGKVFSITGQTADGNVALKGVPFAELTALPSTWTIDKELTSGPVKSRLIWTEIFSAQPDPFLGGNNLYDLQGAGADLCIFGFAALSKNNNLNIAISEFAMPDNMDCTTVDPTTTTGVVSATVGRINLRSGVAKLSGVEEGSPPIKISMPVFCQ